MRTPLAALSVYVVAAACAPPPPAAPKPVDPARSPTFALAGQFDIAPLTRFPPETGPQFGGISGLAATSNPSEFLAVSDDRPDSRVYRLRIRGAGPDFHVEALDLIMLERSPGAPAQIDPESIVRMPNGHMLIASEGVGSVEPRVPPALLEFGPRGNFVRTLEVRSRYVPEPMGAQTKGVRSNMGFESLTLPPRGDRLFLATESPLVQDGGLTTFERGAPARILEYVAKDGSFAPAREFVYMVEPIHRVPFEPGIAVNGLVELLALDDGRLLALERSYVAEAGDTGRNRNRIRLFRVSLDGATDVAAYDSLRDAPNPVPVSKTLLLDLSTVDGLSGDLAPSLDNFEGLAFGPRLPDGRATLLLVSDDNFNEGQRTWFLLFAVDEIGRLQRIQ